MQLVAGGDEQALARLVERHGRLAWSIAVGIVGDAEAAHEVVQDAWLDLWRSAPSYDAERAAVTTWLVRLVRARSIDRLRRERAVRRSAAAGPSASLHEEAATLASGEDIEAGAIAAERRRLVHAALHRLPKEQRVLIELAFIAGYTHRELAEALQLPAGTVKTRLFRGLARLHELLADDIEGGPT